MVAELGQRGARFRVAAIPGQGDVDLLDCPIGTDVRRDRLLEQRVCGLPAKIGDGATDFGRGHVGGAHRAGSPVRISGRAPAALRPPSRRENLSLCRQLHIIVSIER